MDMTDFVHFLHCKRKVSSLFLKAVIKIFILKLVSQIPGYSHTEPVHPHHDVYFIDF